VPSGFLSDANRPCQLATADTILSIGDCPHGNEPLVQAERRILKDRPDLDGELMFAGATLEHPARADDAHIVRFAVRARHDAIGPFDLGHEGVAHVQIGVMLYGFIGNSRSSYRLTAPARA